MGTLLSVVDDRLHESISDEQVNGTTKYHNKTGSPPPMQRSPPPAPSGTGSFGVGWLGTPGFEAVLAGRLLLRGGVRGTPTSGRHGSLLAPELARSEWKVESSELAPSGVWKVEASPAGSDAGSGAIGLVVRGIPASKQPAASS